LLAAEQTFLVGGIDLPDVMRSLRWLAFGVRFASGRRRIRITGAEPTLQGSGRRQELARVAILQGETQKRSAPVGVLLVQEEGLVVEWRRR
jgi:hypothetical protein